MDKDLAARIDNGKSYVYGDTALHLSETDFIIDGLNNSSFITDHSYLYTLFSIAKIISISKENDENINVILGLSYTKEFEFSLTELTDKLKGNHTVEFLDLNENVLDSVSFTVTDIYKYLQPLPVIYNLFVKDNLSCNKEDLNNNILIIDCGSFTIDTSLICNMKNKISFSIPIGSNVIYEAIRKELLKKDVHLQLKDIEEFHIRERNFLTRKREVISISFDYFPKVLLNFADSIQSYFDNHYGKSVIDKVYLTGGASDYFLPVIQKIFPDLNMTDDKFFGNASGMIKTLKLKHEKKGLRKIEVNHEK